MTTTTTTTSLAQGVKAIKMTAEQVKADSAREYNPQAWERNVDSYGKYKDVEFYKISKNEIYDYDRFFVVYTLSDGIRFLNDFGYSSSLTNGGFYEAFISSLDIFVNENNDVVEYKMLEDNNVYIKTSKIRTTEGEYIVLNNSKEALKLMAQHSQRFGKIWTKESITA